MGILCIVAIVVQVSTSRLKYLERKPLLLQQPPGIFQKMAGLKKHFENLKKMPTRVPQNKLSSSEQLFLYSWKTLPVVPLTKWKEGRTFQKLSDLGRIATFLLLHSSITFTQCVGKVKFLYYFSVLQSFELAIQEKTLQY